MWIYHANDMKYSLIKIYMNVISKEFRILATCAYNKDSSTEMSYSCNVNKNVDDRKRQFFSVHNYY